MQNLKIVDRILEYKRNYNITIKEFAEITNLSSLLENE